MNEFSAAFYVKDEVGRLHRCRNCFDSLDLTSLQ
jgi:hypothetical protein